ncbi:hypothetical protein K402DRAFT_92560 [Aulographum hederae CBS 113979]|uniref:GRF-type domain-containing protein n=1 Tax=Aulographum hederae CBS 113979 TaxID=1176131 RepID=A0A6G1GZH4_9PEZI|nr:hypothetical protein K402DRAFT_92560 [Aulographum hederae CBS 113979]
MFYRGHGRGRGRGGGSSTSRAPKGIFQDGMWQCECSPCLPAVRFEVKKDSPNKGRKFYTCQCQEPKKCGFFLWEEDARPREAAAVMSNSRTELQAYGAPSMNPPNPYLPRNLQSPPQQYAAPSSNLYTASPPPPYRDLDGPTPAKRPRRVVEEEQDDDDTYGWSLSAQEEREMLNEVGRSVSPPPVSRQPQFVTPVKRKRSEVEIGGFGMPTPVTDHRQGKAPEVGMSTPHGNRLAPASSLSSSRGARSLTGGRSPSTTPTPSRFKDAASEDVELADLATDVINLLKESHTYVDDETKSSLETMLKKHSLQMQGIIRGGNISRLSLAAKDARIQELQLRVTTLEAELETEKAVVDDLKWKNQHSGMM